MSKIKSATLGFVGFAFSAVIVVSNFAEARRGGTRETEAGRNQGREVTVGIKGFATKGDVINKLAQIGESNPALQARTSSLAETISGTVTEPCNGACVISQLAAVGESAGIKGKPEEIAEAVLNCK